MFFKEFKHQFKGLKKFDLIFLIIGIGSLLISTLALFFTSGASYDSKNIIVMVLSMLSAISAFLAMVTLSNNSIWNFLWALLQSLMLIYVLIVWESWSQLALAVGIWIPVDIYGFYRWNKEESGSSEFQKNLSNIDRLFWFFIFVLFTVASWAIFEYLVYDPTPILGAIVFSSGTVGIMLAIAKKTSQWFYWVVMSVFSIAIQSVLMADNMDKLYEYVPQIILRSSVLISLTIRFISEEKSALFYDYIYFNEGINTTSHITPMYKKHVKGYIFKKGTKKDEDT